MAAFLSCLPDVGPGPELCNGVDDNCDGTVDESTDSDGDGVLNCDDNCPDAFNPVEDCDANPGTPDEQCDADSDNIGDLCDCTPNDPANPLPAPVGDTLQVDDSSGQTVINWDAVPDVGLYNVSRGYFTEGNTFQYVHQCLDVNVPATSTVDPLCPRPFTLFYYLVTSTCGGPLESSFGQDSFGIPRPQPFGCPAATLDPDGDGTDEALDNCPGFQNPSQSDFDSDSHGDVCDNCPQDFDPTLSDIDGDGLGDVCDPDRDGDTILDDGDGSGTPGDNPCPDQVTLNCDDNCPSNPNPGQEDTDMDGTGDACDI